MPRTFSTDFVLKKKLNEGRYSQVWTAQWTKKNKEVVIKINTGDNQENAFNEAARLAQLQHPFIVDILHCFVVHDLVCVVLEKGDYDLMDYIERNRRLGEAEARRYFSQIVQAVAFCHSKKVAHLDLKPENVFIVDGNVKLGDFELSHNWNGQENSNFDLQIGTVYYAAPEVNITTGPYCSWRADMWSLGVLLYVIVAGTWPYRGSTYEQVEAEARRGRIFFPKTDFSPSLQDLLLRLLSRDPLQRLSCEEVLSHPWLASAAPPRFSFRNSIPSSASEPISICNLFAAATVLKDSPQVSNAIERDDQRKPLGQEDFETKIKKHTYHDEADLKSKEKKTKLHKKRDGDVVDHGQDDDDDDDDDELAATKSSSVPDGFQIPKLNLNRENLRSSGHSDDESTKTPNATKRITNNKTPSNLSSFSSRRNLSARTPKGTLHSLTSQIKFDFGEEEEGGDTPNSSLASAEMTVISPAECERRASSHRDGKTQHIVIVSSKNADSTVISTSTVSNKHHRHHKKKKLLKFR